VAHACYPSTWEAEIRRITVQSQPGQIVCKTLSQKTHHNKRAGRVAQSIAPEFKPLYCKKKKKKLKNGWGSISVVKHFSSMHWRKKKYKKTK
jgi:hypothetical protein